MNRSADRTTPVGASALAEARASLRASEEHFRLLVESVRDYAIFLLDPSGYVASWNAGAERIKGYASGEIVGSHFSRFYPEEDVVRGKCEMELEVAAHEGRFEDEGWRIRKDGTKIWANVVITALRDEAGELVGFAKVTRDLTERRAAEEERMLRLAAQKAEEAAQTANRAKDDFIAHVSHELRTPLNAILGWSRLLAAGLDADRAKRATATIERNAEAMTKLIDDLLDVSRIISGKMRLEVGTVDVPLVVERALESVRLGAEARTISLHSLLDPAATPVLGDASRLQQVVWNLLSNALKFTPPGGRVSVRLRRHEGNVEIIVRDSGKGIDAANVAAMFQPFWQEAGGPAAGSRGLGLGLAICKSIVELHGGRIRAESEGEGRGTTIVVTLPLAGTVASPSFHEAESATPRSAEPSRLSTHQLAGLKVLVVEDEDDARELMRSVLEAAGCVVSDAPDVPTALATLEREMPDLLVSDIGLPGESGYDLMRRVRALPPEKGGQVPAIAVTAYARSEDRMKAFAAGFVFHVPKPVEPSELVMVVAALVSHGRPRLSS